jgi:7-cyano-7-deazaguanine synthase
MDLAVALVSGGMDSCVTAAHAVREYHTAFLHLNYGQKTERRELKAFRDIANFYSIKQQLVVDVQHFTQIGGSSLTDQNINVSKANLATSEIPSSYVPFRNANILAIATSWAEVIGAEKIFIGAVEEDSSGYPDCRDSFFKVFNRLIQVGTKPETNIEIITPLIQLSKKDIIRKAIELEVPLHLTWSCYQHEEVACGVCDSCALRLRAFQKLGLEDPIEYLIRPDYFR